MLIATIDGEKWRLRRLTPTRALKRDFPHLARQYEAAGIVAHAYGSPRRLDWRADPQLVYQLAGGAWLRAHNVRLSEVEGARRLDNLTVGELRALYARCSKPARAELIGQVIERVTRGAPSVPGLCACGDDLAAP